jgi:hypothetical protein
VKIENLEELLIELRGENILLDADVAVIYGVETKRVNEAKKNKPDKFPQGYMFELDEVEFSDLRSKISTAKFAKTRVVPKAFTEKGFVYACHNTQKSASDTSHHLNSRNVFKNQRADQKHQRIINDSRQSGTKTIYAKERHGKLNQIELF